MMISFPLDTDDTRPTFYEICLTCEIGYATLCELAERINVETSVIGALVAGEAVHRADAEKALSAISARTGQAWTLDTVKVALFPTFKEIAAKHHFDLTRLATGAGVPYEVIDHLLLDQPIPVKEARFLLQMASRLSGQDYTLETVEVNLLEEDVKHE